MEITAVLQAFAIRFFVPSSPYGYFPDTIQALKEKYNFAFAPTTIQEVFPADPNQGNVFRTGKFVHDGRTIVIDPLHLYHLGAAASTASSTDDSDLFLDDLMAWASSTFNVAFKEHGKRAYTSQLEFHLDRPLPEYFPHLRSIGASVPRYLPDVWAIKPPYEISAITFAADPAATHPSALGNFRIERRQNVAFDANLYFSEAPLRTKDHIALIEAFEASRQ